jgi:hypothetical protein
MHMVFLWAKYKIEFWFIIIAQDQGNGEYQYKEILFNVSIFMDKKKIKIENRSR